MKRILLSLTAVMLLGFSTGCSEKEKAVEEIKKEAVQETVKETVKEVPKEVAKVAPKESEEKPSLEDAAMKIIKGSDCFACHKIEGKLIGPSYVEIAKKYAGDTKAPAILVKKVKEGGSGVWGPMPMTPHASMKDKDIQTVVDWILSVKD